MVDTTTALYISDANFEQLLDVFAKQGNVFVPRSVEDRTGEVHYSYERRGEGEAFEYYGYRPTQPLKNFLFRGRVKVAEYPAPSDAATGLSTEKVFVVGAAACDVVSLKSLDVIFLQDEYTDIFYRARRDNTIIISEDCTEPRETCFCTLAGHAPYPKEGFDLNLSRIEGGYIVETGSERGRSIVRDNEGFFAEPSDQFLQLRSQARKETERRVRELNGAYELTSGRKDILGAQRESDDWYEHVRTCIECGACLFACPTCHCFLLSDQVVSENKFERVKKWDACSYSGYSRMSGGGSPRLGLMERFRHRYLHKLEYYPENFGFEACTGCGRCIEGCMGKIDMRKVLKALDSIAAGVQ